ncbi:MAG: helix-turn-helix domain-containing protein, partial [Pseudonocardiaceae bacterium]
MKRVDETVQDIGRGIGDYIRQQRNNAQLSLRQLAKIAGVSNPYLSQVERGLRKPSARIL